MVGVASPGPGINVSQTWKPQMSISEEEMWPQCHCPHRTMEGTKEMDYPLTYKGGSGPLMRKAQIVGVLSRVFLYLEVELPA